MKYDFLKIPFFYTGGSILIISIILGVYQLNISIAWKVIIVFTVVVLYSINQFYHSKKMSEQIKAKLIFGILKSIEQFKHLIPGQRLRSNIFFKKKVTYKIKYSYNMDEFADKNIEIPVNLGCTGEAWRTKRQIFGPKEKIFIGGEYKVPDEQLKKVPGDLEWVCSTPILNESGDVIAVLNFDGNRVLNPEQQDKIKRHSLRISQDLQEILI